MMQIFCAEMSGDLISCVQQQGTNATRGSVSGRDLKMDSMTTDNDQVAA